MPLPKGTRALNLGCGITGVAGEGWVNIDNSPNARLSKYPRLRWLLWKTGLLSDAHYRVSWDRSLIIRDLRKRLPFDDNSIDYVYSSHFLEHISREDALAVIAEVRRVLKPEGLVRLVLPDLQYGARKYLDAVQASVPDPDAAPAFLQWLQLSRPKVRDPHLWMYDVPSLSKILTGNGFKNPVACSYRQGRFPDCEVLDVRPTDSLHVEAEKAPLSWPPESFPPSADTAPMARPCTEREPARQRDS